MKTYKLQTLCLALKSQPVFAKTTIPKKSTQVMIKNGQEKLAVMFVQ